uniref:hypothetical protein n=1 Tax=Clostridioides difficile TaxID=1496 RepID=UPI001A9307A3
CSVSIAVLAGTVNSISPVSAVLLLYVWVTVNPNVTFVLASGASDVHNCHITLSFVDDFIFIVYPLATVGIVSVVASCVG